MTQKSFAEVLEETTEFSRTVDAPLADRLKTVATKVRELAPEFADIVDRMVARLDSNGVGLGAPAPGEVMPEFLLPDQNGRLVRLGTLTAKGPVVVSFNRGHWCP